MKIDIHIHTKKTKRGDAHTREITPKKFCEIISNSDVGICAITNHNLFDIDQFNEILALRAEHLQIWPGVELDIIHENKRGHLIVISNPKQVNTFNEILLNLINNESPDKFIIDISKIANAFNDIDVIYIAHYYNKKPNIEDAAIEVLLSEIKNPNRVIKEATDSISAGIFVSHGHNSIYGSDVQDWDAYLKISNGLPELRLPVESFEQFCLLLDKSESTIQTLLASKNKSQIKLTPFKGESPIEIDIWDDVNILFGSKGTGKTEILKSICKYYNDKGIKANLFESNVENLVKRYDLSGSKIELDLSDSDIYDCKEEILFIRNAEEADIANLTSYREHYSKQESSKIAQKLIIREILPIDENQLSSTLSDTTNLKKEFDN
ncbi:AAA family ATPase [Leptospira ilyithenensis]|uniref:AAA family ATPase n=1 Tax=Leptospira ilyithenensis TaxID=2484901 RepID=A0A4R9LWM9_9LEPT|nr:AAA family ATPase [Leptospira ilyithenensis]TGN13975.1 AAA family ATPase [Leptospira ilyithenensis]